MPNPNESKNRGKQGQGAPAAGAPPVGTAATPQASQQATTPSAGETPSEPGATPASGTPPVPSSGTAGSPPASGTTPPVPADTAGAAQQGAAIPETTLPPAGDNNPAAGASAVHPKKGKVRVKCAALKGGKIIVGKGDPVQIDENGFFEVSEAEAKRLLTIPGYEEA